MDFELLKKTQPTFIKGIHNAYKKNRIVQIYLFEGARGTKTIEAAYYLASLILCEGDNKPCGECLSCKRIRKDIHPRIFDVNPMRTTIKKEQPRAQTAIKKRKTRNKTTSKTRKN